MASGPELPEVPYREAIGFEWTETAFDMLTNGTGDLRGEATVKDGITSSRVAGYCPCCRPHDLDDRQTHSAVTNQLGGVWRGASPVTQKAAPRYLAVDITCGCRRAHPGAPDGRTGCGVTFRVELPVRSAP